MKTKIQFDASKPEKHGKTIDFPQCPVCNDGTAHVICKDGKIRFTKLPTSEWEEPNAKP